MILEQSLYISCFNSVVITVAFSNGANVTPRYLGKLALIRQNVTVSTISMDFRFTIASFNSGVENPSAG